MKKNLFAAAGAVLLLAAWSLTACGDDTGTDSSATGTAADTSADTAVITETEPVTTEAVTEAPKRDKIVYVSTFTEDGNRTPISLLAKDSSVAAHIASEGILESVSANCPSWSDNVGSLTVKIFPWNTDYNTTVAGEPVFSQTYVDYEDNQTLFGELFTDDSRGLPAGEYLWWLGDGVDAGGSGVGLWSYKCPTDMEGLVELYQNGQVTTSAGWEGGFTIVIPAE